MPAKPDTMSFSTDSAVRAEGDAYRGEIAAGWDVAGNANGGYLMAIAARAMAQAAGRPHPVTLTGHFLAPGRVGPVTVSPDVLKQGRSFATKDAERRTPNAERRCRRSAGSLWNMRRLAS